MNTLLDGVVKLREHAPLFQPAGGLLPLAAQLRETKETSETRTARYRKRAAPETAT